jgi:PAS domain S-box-containing protein
LSLRRPAADTSRGSAVAAHYDRLFGAWPTGVLVVDVRSRRFLYANSRICTMLGRSGSELLNLGVDDIHPDSALERIHAALERTAHGEWIVAQDVACLRKDGQQVRVELHASRERVRGRRIIVTFLRQLSAEGGAQAPQPEQEAMSRAILETLADAIIAFDENGRVTTLNRAAETLFGRHREDVLGRNVGLMLAEMDADSGESSVARGGAARGGLNGGAGRRLVGRRADGTEFPLLLSVNEVSLQGRRVLAGVVRDLTRFELSEGDLRHTEGRYRMLHEHASDAIAVVDRQGRILDANPRTCELLGYSREELRCMGIVDLLSWDDLAALPLRWSALQTGEVLAFDRRVRCKDGRLLFVQGSASVLPDGTVQAIFRDVTERRRVDEALRATEKRLWTVVSNAPVILWAVDRDGRFTLSEGKGLELLGLMSRELDGWSVREFWADAPDALRNVERALAGEEFTAIASWRGFTFETRYFPDLGEHGNVIGAGGISTDITERIRAEARLRESEERLRQLAENVGVGIWMATPDRDRILYVNPAFEKAWGRPAAEFCANPSMWLETVHPEDRTRVWGVHQEQPFEHDQEYRILRPDGGVRRVHVKVSPVRDGSGTVRCVVGVAEDVTDSRRMQDELDRIRASLATAQRVAHIGSWNWEIESGVMWLSDEAYRILGITPGRVSLLRETLFSLIHPEDQPTVQAAREAALAGPQALSVTYRIIRQDGGIRFVHSTGEVVRDDEGRPVRVVATIQDVTESREAEEALTTLSSAVEQAADHVFITNKEGRILYANPAFESHTGYARKEVIGKTPRILKSGVHPPELYESLWREILSGAVYRGVFVNKKKDGSLYHEEKSIAPIRDGQGRITHFVSAGRDITERKRAEDVQARLQSALANSAEEWRATFDAVESPVLIVDAEGRVRRPNRAARELAGKPYATMVGEPLAETGEGPLWQAFARAAGKAARSKAPTSQQVRDPASGRTWDVGASPLSTPSLKDGGVIVLARDVTSIVDLQESLRRSETMSAMGRLVAGVAHEVRNPLFGISATLDAFDTDFSDRPEYKQYSARLRAEVDRLTHLMYDLLEYGRPATVRFGRGSLHAVLERSVLACAAQARAAGVTIVQEIPEDLPELMMDRGRLVQVFQNLIENAVQHSPPGAAVGLRAQVLERPGVVECVVEDSGPGFREEDLGRVFEPFFTRRRGGTGLGLSIVQRIVLEHGGTIVAANRPEGGAAMTVTLPGQAPSDAP